MMNRMHAFFIAQLLTHSIIPVSINPIDNDQSIAYIFIESSTFLCVICDVGWLCGANLCHEYRPCLAARVAAQAG